MAHSIRILAGVALALSVAWFCGCGGGGGGGGTTTLFPPPEPFNLGGVVMNTSGTPLPGATVAAVVRSTGAQVASTMSSVTGKYGFFLPPDNYTVKASLAGYQPAQVDVNLYAGDKRLNVNITLSK